MQSCLKFARIFWVLAILLMAGGQLAHAYEDTSCASLHASEHASKSQPQQDCPAGHVCCSSHSHILGAFIEVPQFAFVVSISGNFIDDGNFVIEGPAREIDYPPQLS